MHMTSVSSGLYASSQYSLLALGRHMDAIATATERLATNSKLNRAGDDITALSIATNLQTNIATLRGALNNATQADSLLQTAYGGLSTISDVLTQMLSTATQATSGSLTAADRSALQVQMNELVDQIDQIADGTEFNSIKLLDGSVSNENAVTTPTTAATAGTATMTFGVNPGAGQTVIINGVTLTANTQFAVGGSTNATLNNLAGAINTSTNASLSGISASVAFNTLTLSAKAGGALGNRLLVNQAGSTAAFATGGSTTSIANLFQFANGAQNGLFENSAQAYGAIGDTIVDTQTQSRGQIRLSASANYANGETFSIDNGNGGLLAFTFRVAPATQTEVLIGPDTQSTVQNLIETIQEYSGNEQYVINQLDFIRDGTDLIVRGIFLCRESEIDWFLYGIRSVFPDAWQRFASFVPADERGETLSGPACEAGLHAEGSGHTAEHVGDRLDLDGVAQRGAGTMRLDVADSCCVELGTVERLTDQRFLGRAVRCRQQRRVAVLIDCGATQDGEDTVAVGDSI